MNFFDDLVLPQSAHHMTLLKFLLGLTFFLLIPYLCFLLGSIIYSLFLSRKAKVSQNKYYLKLAKSVIDLVTVNKSMTFALGIIPLFSAIFCFAQLMYGTGVNIPGFLLLSVLFFILSVTFIYIYKHSFHLRDIFEGIDSSENDNTEEFEFYKASSASLVHKSGKWGLLFLIISIYLIAGSVQTALDSSIWAEGVSLPGIIFSLKTFIYFIEILALALAVTPAVILYFYFRPNSEFKDQDEEYLYFVKKFSTSSGLIFTIIQPVLIALLILSTPDASLNGNSFILIVFILLLILFISILFYLMLKNSETNFRTSLVYMFVILFLLFIVKDQVGFSTASKGQYTLLASQYSKYEEDLKASLGVEVKTVSGESIFNGRCIACHNFDKKIVGPPYKNVLPKYEGKMEDLVKFILNPVKVDPNYTSMPNQGLKPDEGRAVADYIMKVYEEKYK